MKKNRATTRSDRPGLVEDPLGGLTYQVIGLAMAVHNDLGPGHREETYHNAMTQRFVDAGMVAEREPLRVFRIISRRSRSECYPPNLHIHVNDLPEHT